MFFYRDEGRAMAKKAASGVGYMIVMHRNGYSVVPVYVARSWGLI